MDNAHDQRRLPVPPNRRHSGKTLELDQAHEVLILRGVNGELIGSLSWDSIIDQILAYHEARPIDESRHEPRVSLSLHVRYRTPEGQTFESRAGGIGGGGIFIESTSPLPAGTHLSLEFTLPDRPTEWLAARGVVAWVCPKADQYTCSPGMGIKFHEIANDARNKVIDLVRSIKTASR
ncbi:MAG: PilZ domain-containing protein [Nitrospiraceae bacterium]